MGEGLDAEKKRDIANLILILFNYFEIMSWLFPPKKVLCLSPLSPFFGMFLFSLFLNNRKAKFISTIKTLGTQGFYSLW